MTEGQITISAMTEGQITILAIQRAAVGEALSVWLNTPISTPMEDRMETALAAYERALIRPIAEAPKDGTPILTFGGGGWWKNKWDEQNAEWFIFPYATPTHFRPIRQETELSETANAE